MSCEFVCARDLSVHQKCSNYALTNLFGLCRFVWIIDPLITHPSPHPRAPACPSTPKVMQAREHIPLLLSMLSPSDSHLSFTRSLGVCQSRAIYIEPLVSRWPFAFQKNNESFGKERNVEKDSWGFTTCYHYGRTWRDIARSSTKIFTPCTYSYYYEWVLKAS
jgi:hypothetical protein